MESTDPITPSSVTAQEFTRVDGPSHLLPPIPVSVGEGTGTQFYYNPELEEKLKLAELELLYAQVEDQKSATKHNELVSVNRASRYEAAAVNLNTETDKLRLDVEMTTIALARTNRDESEFLAHNRYNQVFVLSGAITADTSGECVHSLMNWSKQKPGCDIEIILSTEGGSIIAGMGIFDYIRRLQAQGHHITTTAIGMAASMGSVLLQAGDTRRMGREAWLLIHQGSFGASGSIAEMEDMAEWNKMMRERIKKIFAEKSKMSVEQIEDKWHRKDWWLDSAAALEHGFVDEVF